MLAYVYGVVPISLCRSGGCGVSAGNGKGVRIEFDDENDNIGSGAAATGERHRTGRVDLRLNPTRDLEKILFFFLRHDLGCRDPAQQPQHRRRSERRRPHRPERQRESHGALRNELYAAGQHERRRQHHSPRRNQHHRQPLW